MRINVETGYEALARVLVMALDQAQAGKGKERHANGMSFDDQPIVRLPRLQKSTKGLIYQVCKKAMESENMPELERKVHERLGAIVYLAASVLVEHSMDENHGVPELRRVGDPDFEVVEDDQVSKAVRLCTDLYATIAERNPNNPLVIGHESEWYKRLADAATTELPF